MADRERLVAWAQMMVSLLEEAELWDDIYIALAGHLTLREIFEALIATNYKGFVDLEYEIHADDPMPGVIESFAYMRGVLAGMGYKSHE